MKRLNFTFLFLFALLSFVSTKSWSQCAPLNVTLDGEDCNIVLTGLPATADSIWISPKSGGAGSGAALIGGNGMIPGPLTPGAYNYELFGSTGVGADGMLCWNMMNLEAKEVPPAGSGQRDTICCGEDVAFDTYTFTQPSGCYVEIESWNETISQIQSGTVCDTVIHVRTVTGVVTSEGAKSSVILQSDTLVVIPLDINDVVMPDDEIVVDCSVTDLSPKGLYDYFSSEDVGNTYADTLVWPHLVKDSTETTNRDSTWEETARYTVIDSMVRLPDGEWALVDVIVKDSGWVYTTDIVKTPVVIRLKDNPTTDANGASNQTVCNINTKCVDMELTGECGLPVIMRTWTVIDWCDPTKSSTLETVQWIKVEETGAPSITTPDTLWVDIEPWTCDASMMVTATVGKMCDSNVNLSWSTDEGTIDNIEVLEDGEKATLTGLWAGQPAHVTVTARSECTGLSSTSTTVIIARNNIRPVAIAEDLVHVSLTANGRAKVTVEAIDAGSNMQNCGEVEVCIYRADGDIEDCSDAIEVTCDDELIDVVLIARNKYNTDIYSTSWGQVKVERKSVTYECPDDVEFTCDEVVVVPKAYRHSPCDSEELEHDTPKGPGACGLGDEDINYYYDGKVVCTITITYTGGSEPFDGVIKWPDDVTTSCTVPSFETEPTYNSPKCNIVAWSSERSDFIWDGEACGKILIDYTVIDWCTYDAANVSLDAAGQDEGVYRSTQVIKILDDTAPEFGESSVSITVTGGKVSKNDNTPCEAEATVSITATDLCGGESFAGVNLEWAMGDDSGDGGVAELSGLSVGGEYTVTFTATDKCGNVATEQVTFTVFDTKNPTPVCIQDISTAIMANGSVDIWASDYDHDSFDNCSDVDVTFLLDENGNPNPDVTDGISGLEPSSGATITCDMLTSNTFEMKLFVIDGSGNWDYCYVTLRVEDRDDVCGLHNSTAAAIAGEVRTELGDMIESARVALNQSADLDVTGVEGKYAFSNTPMHEQYEITSSKNDDYINGVSTIDLVLIQKHILGLQSFDSPYKVIAADINNDEKITAADLAELRKFILGLYNEFPSNDSWRFVDATQTFDNDHDPFPFAEAISLSLETASMDNDFIGVKIGDVNGNSIANSLIAAGIRTAGTLNLEMTDAELVSGAEVSVDVRGANFSDIAAYQFTMDVRGLELVNVEAGAIDVSSENFAQLDASTITSAWATASPASADDVLFTLTFKATASGMLSEALALSSRVTSAEAYNGEAEKLDVAVTFEGVAANEFALFQNEPNPFGETTTVAFQLAEAGQATLTVFDVTGKAVTVVKGDYNKGYNKISLTKSDLNTTGVLYYQLESGEFTATKKMVVLE